MAIFNAQSVLDQLVVELKTISGLGEVHTGRPVMEAIGNRLAAYVTLGGASHQAKAQGGFTRRGQRYGVMLLYKVSGTSATEERALCTALDAIDRLLVANQTLTDRCDSLTLDRDGADAAEIETWAGMGYRAYPLTVTAWQSETISQS